MLSQVLERSIGKSDPLNDSVECSETLEKLAQWRHLKYKDNKKRYINFDINMLIPCLAIYLNTWGENGQKTLMNIKIILLATNQCNKVWPLFKGGYY